ncbi:DUF2243 domain-containing protein [Azotobacter sp. CWF10]
MTVRVQSDMRKSMLATLLIGMGLMAGVDEIIFHQLLGWHHFYDLATPQIALFSDGLLHSAELIVLVAGFFLLIDLRGRQILDPTAAWAGLFIGLGGFQLFDGIVDHKVLRLHQIRYGIDNLLTYDLIWNASGALLLLIGLLLSRRLRVRPRMA